MIDYSALKNACRENSDFTARIIDKFLIHYAADKDKLGKQADQQLGAYRHISAGMDKSWVDLLKSQYIIHRVMKAEGLIHKYLNHAAISRMPEEDREWLRRQAETPWKFSFSRILDSPETDFYSMEDLFSGEQYLLYSTGMRRILAQQDTMETWFNLIGYNGACWQTFGPLAGFRSFSADDFFFFATELYPTIASEEELLANVAKNPVPYMMLFARSNYPLTVHEGEVLELIISELEDQEVPLTAMEKDFLMDQVESVYRIRLKDWAGKPHFAAAYYDSEERLLQVTAMTQRGYGVLAEALRKHRLPVEEVADIYVRPAMLTVTEELLKREIELMPYELLFEEEDPEENEDLEKLNAFIGLALPDLNAGKEPDVERLAEQVGLDLEANRDAIEQVFAEFHKKRNK
ncbi:hypothetical protein [Cyclobacterium xiamenense]|uniref:hypothetical protein n=1 Tax=Cyclobacterium xiamenense TaxID=1297121 RepID=UPI0035CF0EB1